MTETKRLFFLSYEKIMKLFNHIILLSLFINITTLVITFFSYHYKYPEIYFKELGIAQVYILIFPYLPILLALIGKWVISKKINNFISISFLIGMIPAILMSGICILAFWTIPPLCSATKNTMHYRQVDNGFEEVNNAINDFIPSQIPEQASNITYRYERYSSLFADRLNIEASWDLPFKEYNLAKQNALKIKQFQNEITAINDSSGSFSGIILPQKVSIYFEYNDKTNVVCYHASFNKKH